MDYLDFSLPKARVGTVPWNLSSIKIKTKIRKKKEIKKAKMQKKKKEEKEKRKKI